jgi:hypothetical protein
LGRIDTTKRHPLGEPAAAHIGAGHHDRRSMAGTTGANTAALIRDHGRPYNGARRPRRRLPVAPRTPRPPWRHLAAPTTRPSRRGKPSAAVLGRFSGSLRDLPIIIAPAGDPGHLPLVAPMPQWRQDYPNNVWSGRASQEVFVDLSVVRSCINVSGLSLERMLRATMDISAPAFSLPARPQMGHLGYQCSHAPGRPVLHLVSSSRRPRRETEYVTS